MSAGHPRTTPRPTRDLRRAGRVPVATPKVRVRTPRARRATARAARANTPVITQARELPVALRTRGARKLALPPIPQAPARRLVLRVTAGQVVRAVPRRVREVRAWAMEAQVAP